MDQQLLRTLGVDADLDQDSATGKGGPGKSSLTARLTPAPQVVFRVADPETARALGESLSGGARARVMRDADARALGARDANGVAAGADAMVERAASSSGAPLPTHIQRQFEGSLGADLSSVRVHTGSDSAAAAHAVGAKAYTVGNDIHFAEGRYAPDDPFGMHLLAHEVAHTVQQSGGAQRRQHKLEVSTPHDAAEHEADRAADAMVRGEAATVSSARGVARQVVQRDYNHDLDKAAAEGETQARAAKADKVMSVSTVKDKAEADRANAMITTYTSELNDALASGDAKPYMVKKNNEALSTLAEFSGAAKAQDQGISNFKVLYKNVQISYARLNSMAATTGMSVTDKNQAQGVSKASGTSLAQDHIDNAARSNKGTSAVAERAKKIAEAPGNQALKAKLAEVQKTKEPLQPQVDEVVAAQSTSTNSIHKVTGALAKMKGLDSYFKSTALKAEYAKAKAEVEETNKSVEETLGLLLDVTKSAASEGPAGAAKTVAEKLGPKVATMAAKAAGIPGLSLTPEDEAKDKKADIEAENAKVNEYNAAKTQLLTSTNDASTTLTKFLNKVALLDQKKQEHKAAMDQLGAELDAAEAKLGKKTPSGELGTFQTITNFLGEADTFLADAKAARDVGQGDLSRGTSGSVAQVAYGKQHSASKLYVYIPDAWRVQPAEGPKRYNIAQQSIDLDFGGKDSAADSSYDADDGGISTIEKGCHAISKFIEEIEAYKRELRASLGM